MDNESNIVYVFVCSLNDSFAHVKRDLAATQQRNEMMDFMWSAFRKVAGINNKKTAADEENEQMKTTMTTMLNSMNNNSDAPLAKFDAEDL